MSFSSSFIEGITNLKHYQHWKAEHDQFILQPYSWLSSFPRSANGWVRVVLAAILIGSRGVDVRSLKITKKTTVNGVKYDCLTSGSKNFDIEDLLPDMYLMTPADHYQQLSEDVKRLDLPLKIIKTHHIIDCQSERVIFLFREPLPCLTSTSLLLNPEGIKEEPSSINQTILYFAKFYSDMLDHYLAQKAKNSSNCFFLSHEMLSQNNAAVQYANVMKFLDFPVEMDLIETVLQVFPLRSGYDKDILNHITEKNKVVVDELLHDKYNKALSYTQLIN